MKQIKNRPLDRTAVEIISGYVLKVMGRDVIHTPKFDHLIQLEKKGLGTKAHHGLVLK